LESRFSQSVLKKHHELRRKHRLYPPILEGRKFALLHILKECATYVKFDLHQPIFQAESAAEHFYLIHQGYVALEAFMPGKGVIAIQTLGPGEALGWLWLFPPYRWHFSARSADIVSEHVVSVTTPKRITILVMTWQCALGKSCCSAYKRQLLAGRLTAAEKAPAHGSLGHL
jgi:CRP-like cAMP-binding protein